MPIRSVEISEEQLQELKQIGKVDDRSISYLMRKGIDLFLNNWRVQNEKK